eukprot:scaffold404809_cov50-Prasinocladus_malaysianus.AAC.1
MELSKALDMSLPSTLLFDYPSINLLANHLAMRRRKDADVDVSTSTSRIGMDLISLVKDDTQKGAKRLCYSHATSSRIAATATMHGGSPRPVPLSRWDSENPANSIASSGGAPIQLGSFLDGAIENFDSKLFDIKDLEANLMDPQQRLLLEEVWKSMCNRSQATDGSSSLGSPFERNGVAVFVGAQALDYNHMRHQFQIGIGAFTSTSSDASVLAGRTAFTFGFVGSAVQIATACSSSLVAMHYGRLELQGSNLCQSSLCAGVSLTLLPIGYMVFAAAGMLCPDGHCKTMDSSADGYGRSEACVVTWLKNHDEAAEQTWDSSCILVGTTAVNQDGRS